MPFVALYINYKSVTINSDIMFYLQRFLTRTKAFHSNVFEKYVILACNILSNSLKNKYSMDNFLVLIHILQKIW